MDDSCAVCADALEWAAYGQCGHREVCSTCVVRLRFVLEDRRCCICKTENPFIFITKAMGDYTRVITDFSVFPAGATEGKVAGGYWYHEDTQAYFDDAEHYRMVKAMCRLSCRVCDSEGAEGAARRNKYKGVDQLKGHLFHQHKLFMCNLCLEGRKVFICEQKVYTRSQLNQHIHTGDSEVDGSESERGGFMGHPMCEFCKNPFYGDNELYMHMSTEHYTCHICQRQHPGQYDYYRNYDDLEIHFRQEHFLCEDEACLAKKFVVFQAEAEMKRHNTMEHGGHMSRSKRNAALQLPTSFRYRRNNEDDQRRGRRNGFRRDQSLNQLSMAIEASLGTVLSDVRAGASPSGARPITDHGNTSQNGSTARSLESVTTNSGSERPRSASHNHSSRVNPVIEESSFPPLSERESAEPSSRYAQSLQNSSSAARLGEESFPPLPKAKKNSKLKSNRVTEGSGKNTLAARLHLRNKSSVLVRGSAWSRPSSNKDLGSSSSASSETRSTSNRGISLSTSASRQPRSPTNPALTSSTSESSIPRAKGQGAPSSLATLPGNSLGANSLKPLVSVDPWNTNAANMARHSASAHNLVEGCSSNNNTSSTGCALVENQGLHKTGYTASAVVGNQGLHRTGQPLSNAEGVQTANKSLVERIRASLGMDNDTFAAFKNISGEYRQGKINTWEYLSYVEQFGLSHLVLELAQLCPDPNKQKELTDAYSANLRGKGLQENGGSNAITSKEVKKGKGKGVAHEGRSSSKYVLTDNILDTVRKLQLNLKHGEEEVETLSKDGYRTAKGKQQLSASPAPANSGSASAILANTSFSKAPSTNASASKGGSNKQQKKYSKFHRTRLGDGSVEAFLEPGHPLPSPERPVTELGSNTTEGLPVRGVWRNGGGMKLVAKSLKKSPK